MLCMISISPEEEKASKVSFRRSQRIAPPLEQQFSHHNCRKIHHWSAQEEFEQDRNKTFAAAADVAAELGQEETDKNIFCWDWRKIE